MLLGLRFVAFRDAAGQAHVLSDTCIHRGGSLSRGKVMGDYVACPYHGWQYDGAGRCRVIPGDDRDRSPPARAKVDSYPVEERYGIVFAFLGDLPADQRPPLYNVPELGAEGWRANQLAVLNINCYYERSMENGLDPAHNGFVHPAQGFPPMLMETFSLTDRDWGSRFELHFGDPQLELTAFARDANRTGELRAGSWFHGPNTLMTSIFVNADSNFVQHFFEAPLDRQRTRIYFLNMRNWLLDPAADEKVMSVSLRIAHEDIGILEELYPVRTPETLVRELLTPADAAVVRYREHLKRWQAKGWRIDTRALQMEEGDTAYAIPSPARRETGNWVLPPVPLMAAGD
jgi:phenylpropionate dioxygenase-like ring-hydroxylating dioxygenase large terminal subunit